MKWTIYLIPVLLLGLFFWSCTQKPVQPEGKIHPDWVKNAVIYELNTRQFSPEGMFAAAQAELPRLKELGVDVVWIMPIYPIGELERKGTLGSYYAISDYKAVNPEFGTLDDFRAFVSESHRLGMKVIIDWVANHTSPDAVWTVNKDWYVLDSLGDFIVQYDWTDIAKLDYNNPDMREAMIDAMVFWLREADIDGFRCDVAGEVPTDFWEEAVVRLQAVDPEVFMLAEAEKPELNEKAFDAYYGWEMHHVMNLLAKGERRPDSLWTYFKGHDARFPKNAVPMMFTSNHDENSWNGTEFERMGDAAKTFAVFTYVIPGMPLIYNGQEAGFDRRLEFFEKDSIDWHDPQGFTPFYQSLNRLKHSHPALYAGTAEAEFIPLKNDRPKQLFSLARRNGGDRIVAFFNLSPEPVTASVQAKELAGNYTDYFEGTSHELTAKTAVDLAPWGYRVYVNR